MGVFPIRLGTANVDNEIELAAVLSSGGTNIPKEEAMAAIWGGAVALT